MRAISIYLAILTVVVAVGAVPSALAAEFGWTISASSDDPDVSTGTPTMAVISLYLWLQCGEGDGMAAAEMQLLASGGLPIFAFSAMGGFLNAGTATDLLLAVGGCPNGPIVAGYILILDLPGDICIVPSAANGLNVTVECSTLAVVQNRYRGYSNIAGPCESQSDLWLCEGPVSVEDSSWGGIKAMYR